MKAQKQKRGTYYCPTCAKAVVREGMMDGELQLLPLSGATIQLSEKAAPRIKCPCGKVIILLKGML